MSFYLTLTLNIQSNTQGSPLISHKGLKALTYTKVITNNHDSPPPIHTVGELISTTDPAGKQQALPHIAHKSQFGILVTIHSTNPLANSYESN